jgi:phosphatidylserine/phosphatidylglycerophosphate/cardiolipin synthase-like enzyme
MLNARVGLASRVADIKLPDLVRVANALSVQVARDLAPRWSVTATVTAIPDPDRIEPGVWPIFIVPQLDDDAAGVHQTEHGQPFALVLAGDTWSLAASHECLEMIVDPSGNRLVPSTAIRIVDGEVVDAAGKFEFLVEVCDPSEDPDNAYLIDDVLVSDFYTPRYFDHSASPGAEYSFTGRIKRPRQVLQGGYLSWHNAEIDRMQQVRVFGEPELRTFPSTARGAGHRPLRGFVDSKSTRTHLSKVAGRPIVERLASRRSRVALTATDRGMAYLTAMTSLGQTKPAVERAADPSTVLRSNISEFARAGVLSVRVGRLKHGDKLSEKHGIVAFVDSEQHKGVADKLPQKLDGVPVQVREGSELHVMRQQEPTRFFKLGSARHELRLPRFDTERFFDPNGNLVPAADPFTAAHHTAKPKIDYTAPSGVKLDEVQEAMTLTLHASPDAGWPQLQGFLKGVEQELVVGMYDFTSAHVLQAVKTAMATKKLSITLDHPAKNPTADQTDEETVSDLQEAVEDFESAWALTNADKLAPEWIYPNAYHIKVAVADGKRFWLSSGNWNNSNQPEFDPKEADAAKIFKKSDRDWHVICDSSTLAGVFRAYLMHDLQVASEAESSHADTNALLAAVVPAAEPEVPEVAEARAAAKEFFAPKTVKGTFRVQPLLTPDNYHEHVLALIQSAKKTFKMQTQYIHPSDQPGDEAHQALIKAVVDADARGVKVQLITSEFQAQHKQGQTDWLEKALDAGIPAATLRIQDNVHNKGIVVDGKVAMVSSQNWSADGTLRNRDAGLIIFDPGVASYFEAIFDHDWEHLARAAT